jgi:D-alanyl-D-alanine-carboxypeptidase/D-alanyl-D-alanine-endopeptidase
MLVILTIGAAIAALPTNDEPWVSIERACRAEVEAEFVPGLVAGVVTATGSEIRGFGAISASDGAEPDAATIYEIGSITKVFTALLLAEAVRRGEVTLDDPLVRWLPSDAARDDEDLAAITLFQLATHSAGLPRMPPNFAPRDPFDPYADYDAERLRRGFEDTVLERQPGERYAYSNFGFGLLGEAMVAAAKEREYESLLATRIFAPLAMRAAHVAPRVGIALAAPHAEDFQLVSNWTFDAMAGAGAVRASGNDLAAFASAALKPEDSPLAAALRACAEQRFVDPATGTRLGLGWHFGTGVALWHNGGTGGYHSFLAIDPMAGVAVFVLANASTGRVDALGVRILALARGETPQGELPPPTLRLDDAALDSLVGAYRHGDREIELRRERGERQPRGLYLKRPLEAPIRLVATAHGRLESRADPRVAIEYASEGGEINAIVQVEKGATSELRTRMARR